MPMYREQKFGICKFVNYNSSTPEKAERVDSYINHFSRTNSKYTISNYMAVGNAKNDIEIIEKRWNPRGTRSFKQGIISFGKSVKEFSPERAVKFMKEVLEFYANYPWLAAIHTNKPERLHSHFLLVTTNVHTGLKLSQSPRDLRKFKAHYNTVAAGYNLPLLQIDEYPNSIVGNEATNKGETVSTWHNNQMGTCNQSYYNDKVSCDLCFDRYEGAVPYFDSIIPETNIGATERIMEGAYMNAGQNMFQTVIENYREDYQKFFGLGFEIGGKNHVK